MPSSVVEDMENGKPAPDIFLKTARVLKSDESSCVVIEDSGNGVLAANRAGMKVIGYINPSSGVQESGNCNTDYSAF